MKKIKLLPILLLIGCITNNYPEGYKDNDTIIVKDTVLTVLIDTITIHDSMIVFQDTVVFRMVDVTKYVYDTIDIYDSSRMEAEKAKTYMEMNLYFWNRENIIDKSIDSVQHLIDSHWIVLRNKDSNLVERANNLNAYSVDLSQRNDSLNKMARYINQTSEDLNEAIKTAKFNDSLRKVELNDYSRQIDSVKKHHIHDNILIYGDSLTFEQILELL